MTNDSNETSQSCDASQSWRKTLFVLIASFLPLAVFWYCVYVVWPWRYFDCFDPEGIHFAAGLSIARGYGPGNVDNPAIPLQTLGAILSRVLGFGILDLERFRPYGYALTIGLRVAAAWALLRYVVRDIPVPWQITVLWIPWLAPEFSMMSRQWCPETMYYPMGVVAVAVIYRNLNDLSRWQNGFLVGVAVGSMIGVKFLFVAWAAAALISILITNRPRTAAMAGLALCGGVVSGFVVATLPAISRYPRMCEWLVGLATKTGQYGTGSKGIVDFDVAAANLMEILRHQKIWTVLIVALLAALLIRRPWTRVSIFCLLAAGISYTLVLKHFAPRYLAPTGLIALLAGAELLRVWRHRLSLWSGVGACLFVGLLLTKSLAFDIWVHRAFVGQRLKSKATLDEFLTQHGRTPDSIILYGWRAFVPAYTVRFMSLGENHRFDAEVDAAFPNEGVVYVWPDAIWYPNGKTSWDFIVLGREYGELLDPEGAKLLRRTHPNWDVDGYVVIKNDGQAPSTKP